MSKEYAKVVWSPEDIKDFAEKRGVILTETECVEFLERNAKHIRDRLTELGRDVIETFVHMDGLLDGPKLPLIEAFRNGTSVILDEKHTGHPSELQD